MVWLGRLSLAGNTQRHEEFLKGYVLKMQGYLHRNKLYALDPEALISFGLHSTTDCTYFHR